MLILFVRELAQTICTYLAGVQHLHVLQGLGNPVDRTLKLKLVLKDHWHGGGGGGGGAYVQRWGQAPAYVQLYYTMATSQLVVLMNILSYYADLRNLLDEAVLSSHEGNCIIIVLAK
jgi:hypothetical protein